jgi:hypothetical protein
MAVAQVCCLPTLGCKSPLGDWDRKYNCRTISPKPLHQAAGKSEHESWQQREGELSSAEGVGKVKCRELQDLRDLCLSSKGSRRGRD